MAELWYFTRDGQAQDPVTKAELAQLAGSGLLKPTDLVWTEGMAQWVRASSTDGIFAEDDALTVPYRKAWDTPRRGAVRDLDPRAEERPSRHQHEDYDDRTAIEDEQDYDRPARRKRGLSSGAKAAIVAGVLVSVLLVVGVVLLLVLGGGGNSRSFSLAAAQVKNGKMTIANQNFQLPFKAGNKVEIWVKSTGKSDVDLYVYDANNRLVEFDDGDSADCYVRFMVNKNQTFRVEVKNEFRQDQQWRNGANSGTLTFKEGPLAPGEVPPAEYTNRLPWFMQPGNGPGVRPINPGIGGPFNPPNWQPPGFKGPGIPQPGFPQPGFPQPPGFKGPNFRPINPGFPNNPNRRP